MASHPALIVAVVMLGNFLGPLYSSTANVAIPNLVAAFGSDVTTMEWVVTGYMLGYSIAMPLAGWLADTFGRRRMYILGVMLFTLFSVAVAFAWDASSLIAFRILEAVGGGIVSPTGMAIVTDVIPPAQRGRALGLWGMGMMLAPAFGPWISGLILDDLNDWRLIFMLGVPIGIVGILVSLAFLPKSEDAPHAHAPFDFLGFSALSGSLACFLVPLTQGNRVGWDDPWIRGSFSAAVVLFAAFLYQELHSPAPMLDLKLFRERTFSIAVGLRGIVGTGYYFAIFLLPLFTQNVLQWTPTDAGAVLIPGGLAMAFLMPVSGALTDRIGARPLVLAGLAVAAYGTYLFSTIDMTWGIGLIAVDNLVRNGALGLLFTPLTTEALMNVPRAYTGAASGIMNTVWQVGGSLGIAIGQTFLTDRQAVRYSDLRGDVVLSRPPIARLVEQFRHVAIAHGLPAHAALSMVQQFYAGVALVQAYGDTFLLAAVVLAACVPAALLLSSKKYRRAV